MNSFIVVIFFWVEPDEAGRKLTPKEEVSGYWIEVTSYRLQVACYRLQIVYHWFLRSNGFRRARSGFSAFRLSDSQHVNIEIAGQILTAKNFFKEIRAPWRAGALVWWRRRGKKITK
ncbi:MAG TPA: hypothetical protein DCX92_00725 [Bacteroidetes bacterium]|nr:hypothetical protein [Bacteroidota bacterium]